jgi:hypothetical protein
MSKTTIRSGPRRSPRDRAVIRVVETGVTRLRRGEGDDDAKSSPPRTARIL